MAKSHFWKTTPVRELVKWAVWCAVTFPALWVLMTVARLIWVGGGSLIDRINAVDKEAGVQAWATLAGSFGGAFLAGAFAVGSFILQRWWQRRDDNEKITQLLRRALPRHLTPPWTLEYLFVPLAQNLADARDSDALWRGQINEFPCAFDISELVEERISEGASDVLAGIHEIRRSRERIFTAINWAKTQHLADFELYQSRFQAMNALLATWYNYIWLCRELIKRGVIDIHGFEESADRAAKKLLELSGKTAIFPITPPAANP